MKTQGNTVGVIGLGLIGCSLAIGLKKSGFAARVLGSDKCPEHEREALQAGHIDEIATSEQIARLSDTVIVAVPVDVAAEVVCGVLDASGDDTTVIDVGSTKQRIVRAVASHPAHARFVPTHPMAGTENSGPLAAVDGLFEGRTVILLPYPDADPERVQAVERMYAALDASPVYMDAERHDMSVAYVSHISHISSYALALTVLNKERDERNITNLAAGGFSSTARLAKSSAAMWEPIFLENREAILDVIDEYIENMILFKHAIKSANGEVVRTLIRQANKVREVLEREKK